jgi:hypothetical protein
MNGSTSNLGSRAILRRQIEASSKKILSKTGSATQSSQQKRHPTAKASGPLEPHASIKEVDLNVVEQPDLTSPRLQTTKESSPDQKEPMSVGSHSSCS